MNPSKCNDKDSHDHSNFYSVLYKLMRICFLLRSYVILTFYLFKAHFFLPFAESTDILAQFMTSLPCWNLGSFDWNW